MKIKRSMASFCMLVFLFVPLGVFAKNPLPFAEIDDRHPTVPIVQEKVLRMQKLNSENTRRIKFYELSETHTDYSEVELGILTARGGIEIKPCGELILRTYGLNPDGSPTDWRFVTPTEMVVFIVVNDTLSIPWFLPRCMNPVRQVQLPQAPPEPEMITECFNECGKSGPQIPFEPFQNIGANSIYFGHRNFGYGVISTGGVFPGMFIYNDVTCGQQVYQYTK